MVTCKLQVWSSRPILQGVKAPKSSLRARRSGCPISFALDLLGDRWTLLILRDLVFKDKGSYGELLASEEGIATNILADRLQRLECAGILRKGKVPRTTGRGRYELTEKGLGLVPILVDLAVWGGRNDPHTAAPQAFLERAERDREGLLAEIVAHLRIPPETSEPPNQARSRK